MLPQAAIRPCVLDRLPDAPTEGDLEVAYVARGAALAACETARQLAVEDGEFRGPVWHCWHAEFANSATGTAQLVPGAWAVLAGPRQILPGARRA